MSTAAPHSSKVVRHRGVSKTESRVLEALRRRDRHTGRPRTWLNLREDRDWLVEEVGTPHVTQLVHQMAKKGSLYALGAGRYVVAGPGSSDPSQTVSSLLAVDIAMGHRRYYVAFAAALSDHGLIDETVEPMVAIYGRAVGGHDRFRVQGRAIPFVRTTSERRWFGHERIEVERRAGYWRSDLERTLLDALERPDLAAGHELALRSWERASRESRADPAVLSAYSARLGRTAALRAAYVSRAAGLSAAADSIMADTPRTRGSSARLDPTRGYGDGPWPRDPETGLLINLPEHLLRGWMSYGK